MNRSLKKSRLLNFPQAPPSMGEEIAEEPAPLAPPPGPSLDLPPVPTAPEISSTS